MRNTRQWVLPQKNLMNSTNPSKERSKDKAVIIKVQAESYQKLDWLVTQVNWDEMDPKRARKQGIYKLDWYVTHQLDSRTKTRAQYRYWPEVHKN